jgi:hypothetical protein
VLVQRAPENVLLEFRQGQVELTAIQDGGTLLGHGGWAGDEWRLTGVARLTSMHASFAVSPARSFVLAAQNMPASQVSALTRANPRPQAGWPAVMKPEP